MPDVNSRRVPREIRDAFAQRNIGRPITSFSSDSIWSIRIIRFNFANFSHPFITAFCYVRQSGSLPIFHLLFASSDQLDFNGASMEWIKNCKCYAGHQIGERNNERHTKSIKISLNNIQYIFNLKIKHTKE